MKYLWIDLETTGLDPVRHGVIQIAGIVEIDGEIKEEFNFKVRPFKGDGVSLDSIMAHGISIEEMKSYKPPNEIYRKLTKLLSKYVQVYDKSDKFHLLGYNAKFDYDFLRKWFEKNHDTYMGSYIWFPPLDIMNLACFYLSTERATIKNFKLDSVARAVGLKPKEGLLHDASYDIRLTRDLYQALRSLNGKREKRGKHLKD